MAYCVRGCQMQMRNETYFLIQITPLVLLAIVQIKMYTYPLFIHDCARNDSLQTAVSRPIRLPSFFFRSSFFLS
ncbi:hypothetical protein K474DRAFT_926245 [Panus rudis PR-1116 ss-1]|nr:hypothetical protein K474DRAFT_926245 [Panus rudis PR-1116 ss-1]